jgi:DNA-binding transcriptional MerR regulator
MIFLDIGEVAAETGIRPSALRYYEEIGLISSTFRRGLRRQYPRDVLLQLKLITMGQTAGFSLREMSKIFGKNVLADLPRDVLNQKAEILDRRIRELTALRDTMRHVANCSAPSHLECPTFRRLLSVAGKRSRRRSSTHEVMSSPA